MKRYQVIVGNVGTVYDTDDEQTALEHFTSYRGQSLAGLGRVAFEPVIMTEDGEPVRQFAEPSEAYRKAAERALQAWKGGACNVRALARELTRAADAVCEYLDTNGREALHGPAGAPLRVFLDQINHLCGPFDRTDAEFCESVPQGDLT